MNVFGIETSCDETSASVVQTGGAVLSSVVLSQSELHGPYGGVVPEIASRCHVETLPGVIRQALDESGVSWDRIDMIAVTYGPGLASSLLVGLSAAKALALRLNKPLCAVNHLRAHMYSAFLGEACAVEEADARPYVALVVSGGHTCLVGVDVGGRCSLLGQTIDDAAGEAFDKGANLLGLGYPGGPAIDRTSRSGDPRYVRFPRGRLVRGKTQTGHLDPDFCFSFSGVKTALLYYLKDHPLSADGNELPDIAASYQEAIVDAVVGRCALAMRGGAYLVVGGGVSLNGCLRSKLAELAQSRGFKLLLAEPRYCADNAAMVAALAETGQGQVGDAVMELDVAPSLPVVPLESS